MKFRFPLFPLHVYVFFSLVIFLLVQALKYYSINAPEWVFNHLNDFLVIPIVGLAGLHVVWILKKDRSLRLGVFTILSLAVLYSLFFEYYLPQQSLRYTGDGWDVVCYFAGALVFYLLQES